MLGKLAGDPRVTEGPKEEIVRAPRTGARRAGGREERGESTPPKKAKGEWRCGKDTSLPLGDDSRAPESGDPEPGQGEDRQASEKGGGSSQWRRIAAGGCLSFLLLWTKFKGGEGAPQVAHKRKGRPHAAEGNPSEGRPWARPLREVCLVTRFRSWACQCPQ